MKHFDITLRVTADELASALSLGELRDLRPIIERSNRRSNGTAKDAIYKEVASHVKGVTARQLVKITGRPTGTVSGCLAKLQAEDLVRRSDDHKWHAAKK